MRQFQLSIMLCMFFAGLSLVTPNSFNIILLLVIAGLWFVGAMCTLGGD